MRKERNLTAEGVSNPSLSPTKKNRPSEVKTSGGGKG